MRHPRYKDAFYISLRDLMKKHLLRIGPGKRATKGGYVDMQRHSLCVKTGYDIVSDLEGLQCEYEFGKSVTNMIYALLCRLFVSKVVSDPAYK